LSNDSVVLEAETNQSKIRIGVAARNTVWRDNKPVVADYRLVQEQARIGHDIAVEIAAGQSVTLEKVITLFTGALQHRDGPRCQRTADPTHSPVACPANAFAAHR
jgi:trehalose/maltose hydrolase-like predicted phosphorylase